MKKQKIHLPCILVWVIYPILFTVFFCFCFFTCSNKGMQTRDKQAEQRTAITHTKQVVK